MMAVFPALQSSLGEGYRYGDLHLTVMAVAQCLGRPVIDLTGVLVAVDLDARRWQAAPWDAHPNEAAHALMGRAMAEAAERGVGESWRGGVVSN